MIIGMGEVGRALSAYLRMGGRDVEPNGVKAATIHIAYPYQPGFADQVTVPPPMSMRLRWWLSIRRCRSEPAPSRLGSLPGERAASDQFRGDNQSVRGGVWVFWLRRSGRARFGSIRPLG